MLSKLFKLFYLRKQLSVFNNLKTQVHFTEDQKSEYQLNKLKVVLKTAKNIKYYQEFLHGIDIDNLTYSEFIKLPFLTKDIIKNNNTDLRDPNYVNISTAYENTSGGSTGEPVKFMRTINQSNFGAGNYHYANYLNGISPFSKVLILWGALRDMHKKNPKSLKTRLKNFLNNSLMLNTFVLSPDIIASYIKHIENYKPKMIKAYVHSLYDISKYINDNNIIVNCKPIIHTSTGPLYPEIKMEIKKAFNDAHVFSFYGSREVSAIATEVINQDGMQVLYDNVFLEVINKEGKPCNQNEEGEIVITTLNNHYMPLIRYKIGDRAVKSDGTSTFGTLKIDSVLGRTLGVIYKSDGSYVDGQFFTTLFFNIPEIKSFQLIQKDISNLDLNIVKDLTFTDSHIRPILEKIKSELGDVNINLHYKDSIDLSTTGKIMYVYSQIER